MLQELAEVNNQKCPFDFLNVPEVAGSQMIPPFDLLIALLIVDNLEILPSDPHFGACVDLAAALSCKMFEI